jgi:hypothetical protein
MKENQIREAHSRAVHALNSGQLLADADIDLLVAAWKSGEDSESVAVVVEAMTRLVMSRVKSSNGWMASRRDECTSEATLWVLEQLAEFRPGEGSCGAMIASRLSWIVGKITRTHVQGGGVLSQYWYQVRAAAWAEMALYRDLHGKDPDLETLRAATLERLITDTVSKAVAEGENVFAARGRAIASLKKSGKHAALANLSSVLDMNREDRSLDETIRSGSSVTLAATLPSPESENHAEENLDTLYRVALGENTWVRPVFAAHFGMLGEVEGRGVLGEINCAQLNGKRGMSIPSLSEVSGHSREEIRIIVKRGVSRLGAPHAQFAHLSPSVTVCELASGALAGFNRSVFADL